MGDGDGVSAEVLPSNRKADREDDEEWSYARDARPRHNRDMKEEKEKKRCMMMVG